jgi:hypothetical protein
MRELREENSRQREAFGLEKDALIGEIQGLNALREQREREREKMASKAHKYKEKYKMLKREVRAM